MLIPRFMKGIENSTARSRSKVIVRPAIAMSASCLKSSPIIPFHSPFRSKFLINYFFLTQH